MKKALIALFSNKNRKFFLWGLLVFFAVLLIAVVAIPPDTCIFMYLTGEQSKLELIKLIGWGMSGVIAILGVMGLLQRAAALDKQNEMTEKGHIHERFKVATEHLGSEHISVRIAAFNEFYHLAEIESNLRKTIFDILCAHLRQTTKDESESDSEQLEDIKSTEEARSLLNVLFKPHNKDDLIFGGMNADLAGANMQGADLENANLHSSNLKNTKLQKANLQNANLQNAKLWSSNMDFANLKNANLQKAQMPDVSLYYANLEEANLQEVHALNINLQKVNLKNANLQKALLWSANLQEANLQKANLQGAYLLEANLQEANLQKANLQGAYLQKANLQEANLHDVNLQGAKITQKTKMPNDWEDSVKKDADNKTGVVLVDDKEKVIKQL